MMKHFILGIALLTGLSASAQCPDPTFDGIYHFGVVSLDSLELCITEPLVNPDLVLEVPGATVAAAVLQENACPEGYEPIDWPTVSNIEAVYGGELFTTPVDFEYVVVSPFGDTTCHKNGNTGLGILPMANITLTTTMSGTWQVFEYPEIHPTTVKYNLGWIRNNDQVYAFEYRDHCVGTPQVWFGVDRANDYGWHSKYMCVAPFVEEVVVTDTACTSGDLNLDGVVGANDLLILLSNFGLIIQ